MPDPGLPDRHRLAASSRVFERHRVAPVDLADEDEVRRRIVGRAVPFRAAHRARTEMHRLARRRREPRHSRSASPAPGRAARRWRDRSRRGARPSARPPSAPCRPCVLMRIGGLETSQSCQSFGTSSKWFCSRRSWRRARRPSRNRGSCVPRALARRWRSPAPDCRRGRRATRSSGRACTTSRSRRR